MARAVGAALGAALLASGAFAQEDSAQAGWKSLLEKYATQLGKLTVWCDEQSLEDEARRTRDWLKPRDPRRLYLVWLQDRSVARQLPDALPAGESSPAQLEWRKRFSDLRRKAADALYKLCGAAIRDKQVGLAFDLLSATLRENPDHESARRLLGFRRQDGNWLTAFDTAQAKRGLVWHSKYGWLPAAHHERYDNGDRYLSGRWVTDQQDAEAHRDILKGWQVDTEHYSVLTNASLEEGVQLSVELERLYAVWQLAFPQYLWTPEQLLAAYEGKPTPTRPAKKHKIVYFKNKEQYVAALAPWQANIQITIGIYFSERQTAYFFAGDKNSQITLYHEATHQLFHETRAVAKQVGRAANFWIIEGIACYMESLLQAGDYHTLGGADAVRFENAMARLLDKQFYIPLDRLCQYGMEPLQRDPNIVGLYSQSSGLAHFFMHAEDGRYRDALLAYLTAVYSGKDTPQTLQELTKCSFADLDRRYRRFIEASAAMRAEKP